MPTKYVARLNGEIVCKRTTKDRTYAYAVYITHAERQDLARSSWCGRLDLAEREARNWQTGGYSAVILPAEEA